MWNAVSETSIYDKIKNIIWKQDPNSPNQHIQISRSEMSDFGGFFIL